MQVAADNAVFGQTGPKVGSFDAGYGSTQMARLVGQKKAREIWFLARLYTAQQVTAPPVLRITHTPTYQPAGCTRLQSAVYSQPVDPHAAWQGSLVLSKEPARLRGML